MYEYVERISFRQDEAANVNRASDNVGFMVRLPEDE